VIPRNRSPSTDGWLARRSRAEWCVLSGSEKEPDGRERKGGGKGRECLRLACRAKPLTKWNGDGCGEWWCAVDGGGVVELVAAGEEAELH
jgi:hypothetical protein